MGVVDPREICLIVRLQAVRIQTASYIPYVAEHTLLFMEAPITGWSRTQLVLLAGFMEIDGTAPLLVFSQCDVGRLEFYHMVLPKLGLLDPRWGQGS